MNFTSQICTTKEQSERLLALGLKKETADMVHQRSGVSPYNVWAKSKIEEDFFPTWSLHRLLCLTNPYLSINPFGNIEIGGKSFNDIYEGLISTIEYNIKEGYFNKEYLE